MSPEEFAAGAAELFGPSWRGRTAAAFGVDESTIWRTTRPGHDVSGPFAVSMRSWTLIRRMFLVAPPAAPTLPWVVPHDGIAVSACDPRWETDPATVLEESAVRLFGDRWERRAAAALGRNHSTFWRQVRTGRTPGSVVAAFRAWTLLRENCGILPPEHPDAPFRPAGTPDVPAKRKTGSRYADLMG